MRKGEWAGFWMDERIGDLLEPGGQAIIMRAERRTGMHTGGRTVEHAG